MEQSAEPNTSALPAIKRDKAGSQYSFVAGDDTDQPEQSTEHDFPPSWWYRTLFDTWIPEVSVVIFSTACLIAIVAIILVFDNKAAPQLKYGITLNAIIATLATASRSMLIFAVATALSQLKWCWYLQTRRLRDMQMFDDASRGPWGSVTLLFSTRARPLASLGALVTILALAADPFVQLVLTYPTRMVADDSTRKFPLTRATAFMLTDASTWDEALMKGTWSDPQSFYQQPSCPRSNCSWPNFHSVGWCSTCRDAASYVQITNCNTSNLLSSANNSGSTGCHASLGYGDTYSLYRGSDPLLGFSPGPGKPSSAPAAVVATDVVWLLQGDLSWYNPTARNESYLGVLNPVAAFAHLSVEYSNPGPFVGTSLQPFSVTAAEECILSLCVMEYQVAIKQGIARTSIVDTDYGFIKRYRVPDGPYNYAAYGDYETCWQSSNKPTYPNFYLGQPNHSSSLFCPTGIQGIRPGLTSFLYSESIQSQLSGNCSETLCTSTDLQDYTSACASAAIGSSCTSPEAQYIANTSLSSVLDGIAASLSSLALTDTDNIANVSGTAFVSQTIVEAAWYWLVFPFVLNICGILFLLLTIIESRRKKVKPWKASILPLLYHKLESSSRGVRLKSEDVSAMEKVSEATKAQFAYSDGRKKTTLRQM